MSKKSDFTALLKETKAGQHSTKTILLHLVLTLASHVYPKGTSDFVFKKFFCPNSRLMTPEQQQWTDRAQTFRLPFKGKQVTVWKVGTGPALLFVHGWDGLGVQFQHFFQPALDAGFSLVFFDAPAHGQSTGTTTNYMELTAFLEVLTAHECCADLSGMVGHSLGAAAIVNHVSRHHPSVPLVLVAPVLRLLELLFTNFQTFGVPENIFLKLIDAVEEEYQLALDKQNPIDLIEGVQNPVQIIHDSRDKITPVLPARQLASKKNHIILFET